MAKKTPTYVVGKGKSLFAKNGEHLKPGDKLEPGTHFSEAHLKDLIRDGFVLQKGRKADDEDEDEDGIPHEIETDAKKDSDPLGIAGGSVESKIANEAQRTKDAARAAAKNPPLSKWILDPAGLRRKSLDALNVMIKERDANGPTFQDAGEAIKFLSRDFKG